MPFIDVEINTDKPWVLIVHSHDASKVVTPRHYRTMYRCATEEEARRAAEQHKKFNDVYLIELMVDAGTLWKGNR